MGSLPREGQPSRRPCHGVHCSQKHMGKAEEDRLAGCVGLPASWPPPPPDIIAPAGNRHPGPARPLTAADKFLTSCPAFQHLHGVGTFVLTVPLPPWHHAWQTCVLVLSTTGTAEAMPPPSLRHPPPRVRHGTVPLSQHPSADHPFPARCKPGGWRPSKTCALGPTSL